MVTRYAFRRLKPDEGSDGRRVPEDSGQRTLPKCKRKKPLRIELILSQVFPMPRLCPDYTNVLNEGSRVHFRNCVGRKNEVVLESLKRGLGSGPYVVVERLEAERHVKVRDAKGMEQLAPSILLLPETVTHETDIALSTTNFAYSDNFPAAAPG